MFANISRRSRRAGSLFSTGSARQRDVRLAEANVEINGIMAVMWTSLATDGLVLHAAGQEIEALRCGHDGLGTGGRASGGGLTFGSSEAQGLGRSGSIRGLGLLGEPREAMINPGTLLDDGLEWLQK
jgi:hypothetical protein